MNVVRVGKYDAADKLQQIITDKIDMKAGLQASHLKDEQSKLPPEVKFVLINILLVYSAQNATPEQKTRVCNICSGMLSIYDVDQYCCMMDMIGVDVFLITLRANHMWHTWLFEES